MYAESRKIQLIEELLKVDSDDTLSALESILKNKSSSKKKHPSIYDFMGIMNKKEISQMKKAIEETCETINENDWK